MKINNQTTTIVVITSFISLWIGVIITWIYMYNVDPVSYCKIMTEAYICNK